MKNRKCLYCGTEFKPYHSRQKYCRSELITLGFTVYSKCYYEDRKRRQAREAKEERRKKKKPKSKDLCTCCGTQPKHPGFRFLCIRCYSSAENSDETTLNLGGAFLP